jgi:Fic family protein
MYNWQQPDWPDFSYELQPVEDLLIAIAENIGLVSGMLQAMNDETQREAIIQMMVAEAMKTSAIEGEYLSRQDVISSIRNKMDIHSKPIPVKDKKSRGAGQLMVEVRKSFALPLTEQMLFAWHTLLLNHQKKINTGCWRTHAEPMQVVSGAIGREKIHFEAPPSKNVKKEMRRFIQWFNDTAPGGKKEIGKAPVRAAIAHLYFESIHPFEDGNGRIGRAIAEKALSQTIGRPVLMSLSQTIEADKKNYYKALEKAQRSNEITGWVTYFVATIFKSQLQAKEMILFTVKKTKFFDRFREQLNARQSKAIERMFREPVGFKGGMTAKKYISITKSSKATATRDLQELTAIGAFESIGGGRSTHYQLKSLP